MDREREPYLAYMLRIWPVETGQDVSWRASLQCVSSGERFGFDNMEALFDYLRKETIEKSSSDNSVFP